MLPLQELEDNGMRALNAFSRICLFTERHEEVVHSRRAEEANAGQMVQAMTQVFWPLLPTSWLSRAPLTPVHSEF